MGCPALSVTTRARHAAYPARAAGQVRSLEWCVAAAVADAGARKTAAAKRALPAAAVMTRRDIKPPSGISRDDHAGVLTFSSRRLGVYAFELSTSLPAGTGQCRVRESTH